MSQYSTAKPKYNGENEKMSYMKNPRAKKDLAITGAMARWYSKSARSRIGSLSAHADMIAEKAAGGARILEVAPGPGYLSIELAKRGFAVTGVELSADMVAIAKANAAEAGAGAGIDFRQGNASALPLEDGAFDFIICMAAFKNFSEPQKAVAEMHRVLKPGGVALINVMNRENTAADIEEELKTMRGLSGFDRWFIRLSFKMFLRNGAYNQAEFEEFAKNSPFPKFEITKRGCGFGVWLFKAVGG
jgi:ubiquinone/menaquinone biosynthesis C-methylase UbiE